MAGKKSKQFMVDAKKMTDEQLVAEIAALEAKVFTLRSQTVTEKVEDTSQFKKLRRNIARLHTERNARRHAKNPGARQPKAAPAKQPAAKSVKMTAKSKGGAKAKRPVKKTGGKTAKPATK
jgi:ribosomal protein L29